MRLPEVHMVGQERAAHSAAECSVGEDTHVQILHLCLFTSVEQRRTEIQKRVLYRQHRPHKIQYHKIQTL